MPRVVSFDVGIKNMAYCIFDISNNSYHISDWNVINLLEIPVVGNTIEGNNTLPQCNSYMKNGNPCKHAAKYYKTVTLAMPPPETAIASTLERTKTEYYCDKHARSTSYLMPTKKTYFAFLKKQKVVELQRICATYKIEYSPGDKRPVLLQKILDYFERRSLKYIDPPKPRTNAMKESLITIARNIRDKFDKISAFQGITHVLIENQISPIASRMTSIQGLLTQYFIMRYDSPSVPLHVEFISSRNKLKMFSVQKENTSAVSEPLTNAVVEETTSEKRKYIQHKKDSVIYTQQLMEKHPEFRNWEHVLKTSKKDDLADCFLQGYWYITNVLNNTKNERM